MLDSLLLMTGSGSEAIGKKTCVVPFYQSFWKQERLNSSSPDEECFFLMAQLFALQHCRQLSQLLLYKSQTTAMLSQPGQSGFLPVSAPRCPFVDVIQDHPGARA